MQPDDSPATSASIAVADPPAIDAFPRDAEFEARARATLPPELPSAAYPRDGLVRFLRWLLVPIGLAFLYYLSYVFQQLVLPWLGGATLTSDDVVHGLLVGRLIPALTDAPIVAIAIPLAVLVALILAGAWSVRDGRRERAFSQAREQWDQRLTREVATLRAEAQRMHNAAIVQRAEDARLQAAAAHKRLDDASTMPAAPQGPPKEQGLLPLPQKPFVGREDTLADLERRLLQGGETAITAIEGLGGIGKSTLAAVAVNRLASQGHFKDGIAVVDCLNRADAPGVLRVALTRFDPRALPDAPTDGDLATAAYTLLHGKDALLVFDNVEPDLDAEALLRPLRGAGATVLLTARQRLPLADDDQIELDLLPEDRALDLFAEWYGLRSAADLAPGDLSLVRRIVRALDRHTYAVQLAAAEVKDMRRPLGEYAAERERDPLRIAGLGANGTLAVKQTLKRSIDQLPDDGHARRLFATIAAFPTPEFGRNAAIASARSLGLPDPEGAVNLLVRRAILSETIEALMPAASDRERLRLHPLMHELASEAFASWPPADRDAASLALATYYAGYANDTADSSLSADDENITGMLEWAHDHDQQRLVIRLCSGMQYYWRDRSRVKESQRYPPWGTAAAEAAAQATGDRDDLLRAARLSLTFGVMLLRTGKLTDAEEILIRNLAIRRQLVDRSGEGAALSMLGQIAQRRGQLDAAEQYFQQSLVIRREVQDRQGEGVVLYSLAVIAEQRGDLDRAEALHRESLRIGYDVQAGQDIADSLQVLGRFLIEYKRGAPDEGCGMLAQAIALYHEMGVPGEAQARETALRLGCDV